MTKYSVRLRNRIIVKDYGFLSFATIKGKIIGNYISQNVSGEYNQKRLDHAKTYTTDALKTSLEGVIQKNQKQLVIWLLIKMLIKLQNFKKLTTKYFRNSCKLA